MHLNFVKTFCPSLLSKVASVHSSSYVALLKSCHNVSVRLRSGLSPNMELCILTNLIPSVQSILDFRIIPEFLWLVQMNL